MSPRRTRAARRRRVGRVSYFPHHGAWYLYYRDGARPVRLRVGRSESEAARLAAERNAELAGGAIPAPTFAPITVAELRRSFLDHHEHVLCSSLATVNRYRTATAYLVSFAGDGPQSIPAHALGADEFLRWLRRLQIAPNGHPRARQRPLRERGIRFILNTCRTLYQFAFKRRHLPPYHQNPFSELAGRKLREDDAKPIFVFDETTEHRFLSAASPWAFAIHFVLAKTGLRPGELAHLLIEELDWDNGWLHVRSKPELGWSVKTRRERAVPVVSQVVAVLRKVVGNRIAGPVFLRPQFQPASSPVGEIMRRELAAACRERSRALETELSRALTRQEAARVAQSVWRDAGMIAPDDIRRSFIQITKSIGLSGTTCPKSWRHTFATLLQDANVDPLIRQVTMGHAPSGDGKGALGMTTVYTHTRPETQKREIDRAVQLWPLTLQLATAWAQGSSR